MPHGADKIDAEVDALAEAIGGVAVEVSADGVAVGLAQQPGVGAGRRGKGQDEGLVLGLRRLLLDFGFVTERRGADRGKNQNRSYRHETDSQSRQVDKFSEF